MSARADDEKIARDERGERSRDREHLHRALLRFHAPHTETAQPAIRSAGTRHWTSRLQVDAVSDVLDASRRADPGDDALLEVRRHRNDGVGKGEGGQETIDVVQPHMLDDLHAASEDDGGPRVALGAVEMHDVRTHGIEGLEEHGSIPGTARRQAVGGGPRQESPVLEQTLQSGVAPAHERDVVGRQGVEQLFPRRVGTGLVHRRDRHEHTPTTFTGLASDRPARLHQVLTFLGGLRVLSAKGSSEARPRFHLEQRCSRPFLPRRRGEGVGEHAVRPSHVLGRQARDGQRYLTGRKSGATQALDGMRNGHGGRECPRGLGHGERPGTCDIEGLRRDAIHERDIQVCGARPLDRGTQDVERQQ